MSDEQVSASRSPAMAYGPALGLGLAGGMRSMTPPAALAVSSPRDSPALRFGLAAAALGELVADKLPFVPSRTDPGPLFGRVVSGAGSGWVAGGPRGSLIGGAGAAFSAFAMERLRSALNERFGVSGLALGLAEDAAAIALSYASAARLGY